MPKIHVKVGPKTRSGQSRYMILNFFIMKTLNNSFYHAQKLISNWVLCGFCFLLAIFYLIGCEPNNDLVQTVIPRGGGDTLVEYEYRIDNSVVSAFTVPSFSTDSTTIFLYETGLHSNIAYHTKTIVHKFTDISEYYDYADSKGVNAELYDIVTDSLAYYATKYNMDSIVLADNEIPSWWTLLEETVYGHVVHGNGNVIFTRANMTQLNDDWREICRGQHGDGNNQIFTLPGIGIPVLGWLGWRNRVSGMIPLLLGGYDNIYRLGFYRKKIARLWSWGLTTTDFCGPLERLNNSSNSWWNAGI